MADDKNIKTPDIPAVDTGPGTGQPQASKAGPEKQEPKAAPLPEADKKPEPEAASPNVSVYNFSEIMKGKKAEERAAHTPEKSSPTPSEKQTQTTEEWHNADIFRAGKMCGLRMVIGLWCKQPEQKSLCTLPLQ